MTYRAIAEVVLWANFAWSMAMVAIIRTNYRRLPERYPYWFFGSKAGDFQGLTRSHQKGWTRLLLAGGLLAAAVSVALMDGAWRGFD